MKFIQALTVLTLSFATLGSFAQDKIHWMTMDEAQEAMKKEPKKILIDVYTKWCGPCKMMMSNTFTNPQLVKYVNEHYYAVKFNAEGDSEVNFKGQKFSNPGYDPNKHGRNSAHEFTKYIAPVNGRIAYPTIVYLDEELNLLSPVQGYLKPAQIEPMLKFFATNAYKSQNWQDFTAAFRNEW